MNVLDDGSTAWLAEPWRAAMAVLVLCCALWSCKSVEDGPPARPAVSEAPLEAPAKGSVEASAGGPAEESAVLDPPALEPALDESVVGESCAAGDTAACQRRCTQQASCSDKQDCNRLVEQVPACDFAGAVELGSLCRLPAGEIAPTQGAVGRVAAACRAEKIESKDTGSGKKLARYLLERPVPAVLGPGNKAYITDRHHLSTGLLEASLDENRKQVFLCPLADRREDGESAFWDYMTAANFAWLRDRRGEAITPGELPRNLAELADDPYRTLSRWVRDSCGYIKCGTECGGDGENTDQLPMCHADPTSPFFLEFRWADFLRVALPIDGVYEASGSAQVALTEPQVRGAISKVRSDDAEQQGLPGWNGDLIEPVEVDLDENGCE